MFTFLGCLVGFGIGVCNILKNGPKTHFNKSAYRQPVSAERIRQYREANNSNK